MAICGCQNTLFVQILTFIVVKTKVCWLSKYPTRETTSWAKIYETISEGVGELEPYSCNCQFFMSIPLFT